MGWFKKIKGDIGFTGNVFGKNRAGKDWFGNLKENFQGKIDPFSNQLVSSWERKSEADPVAPTEFQQEIGTEANPTETNPVLTRAMDQTRSAYLGAGYNQAAAEQAAVRNKNRTWLELAQIADNYWKSLEGLTGTMEGAKGRIDTTTRQNAFLKGFFS